MLRRRYYFVVTGILSLTVGLVFLKQKSEGQSQIMVAGHRLVAEVVRTSREQEQGLSDRKSLCSDCGMLFVFDKPGIYSFWMRRMYFDIDILWITDNKIVDITFGAKKPSREELSFPKMTYQSKSPINKVLEVNAGWVEKNGIKIGDKLER